MELPCGFRVIFVNEEMHNRTDCFDNYNLSSDFFYSYNGATAGYPWEMMQAEIRRTHRLFVDGLMVPIKPVVRCLKTICRRIPRVIHQPRWRAERWKAKT